MSGIDLQEEGVFDNQNIPILQHIQILKKQKVNLENNFNKAN